ncbi:MAG: flippase [Patescibacteria group bacterium]
MSYGKNVAKNAFWLVAATTLNKLIAFVTFAVVARLVGATITGTYFYSVSVTSIFVVFADLGMTPVVIRAISAARDDGAKILGATFRAKLILAPLSILGALAYGILNHVDSTTMAAIAVACLVMTADTCSLALYGALRGKQNLKPESFGMLIGQVLTAIFSVSAALFGWGAVGLAGALLVGSTWNVLWALLKTRAFKIDIGKPEWRDLQILLREAWPFAVAGIAVKGYSYFDSLLIHAYQGAAAVGMYAVGYKMTYAWQFLPLTFVAALYPAMAAAWAKKDHAALKNIFLGSLRLMAAISFPVAAGLSALAPRLIPLIYGNAYLAAVPPFAIMAWVLIPIFMDFPVGSLLNGSHRAHLKTTAMLGTLFVNVVLNTILVPSMGPVGAAWSGLFSFTILFLIGLYFSREDAGGWMVTAGILARACIAAGVSWFAWRVVGGHMPLFAACAFGAAVAIVMGFLLKLVTVADFRWVMSLRKSSTTEEDVHAEG